MIKPKVTSDSDMCMVVGDRRSSSEPGEGIATNTHGRGRLDALHTIRGNSHHDVTFICRVSNNPYLYHVTVTNDWEICMNSKL